MHKIAHAQMWDMCTSSSEGVLLLVWKTPQRLSFDVYVTWEKKQGTKYNVENIM